MSNPPPLSGTFRLIVPMLAICGVLLTCFGGYLMVTGPNPMFGGALLVAGILDGGLAFFLFFETLTMSNIFVSSILRCLIRDLNGFDTELDGFPDDASVWKLPPEFKNSTGTLALHAAGNIRHFFGHVIGGSGYVRTRDFEFAARDLSRSELKALLAAARAELTMALTPLSDADLAAKPPITFGSATLPAPLAALHLVAHLGYHLGQADIHRRVVTGNSGAVGVMGVTL